MNNRKTTQVNEATKIHIKKNVRSNTQSSQLTNQEEIVLRMKHGFSCPTNYILEEKLEENKPGYKALKEFEQKVLSAAAPRRSPIKSKIVAELRKL